MATLKGLIDFEGTLGGITAYTRDGKRILRQKNSVDKKKILHGKNYVRTRENMMEFAGGVAAAKALRQALLPVSRGFTDTYFTGRLQGKYRDMISTAEGKRGQRVFKPLDHADAIKAVPFNAALHLDSVLRIQPVVQVDADRMSASLSLEGFNPVTDIFKPEGATHVELIYAAAVQPAFVYSARLKNYKRTDGLHQSYVQHVSSALIPLDTDAEHPVSLTLPVDALNQLHRDSALVSVLGILFHQQIGFKTYPLQSGKAMGFVSVD